MTPTRIGLAGYGFGGRIFHAPLIASAGGAELAGVVTRSPQRQAEVAADHPGVPVFDSLAALADAGADAVAISTPAETHIPLVLEAVRSGSRSCATSRSRSTPRRRARRSRPRRRAAWC